MEHPVRHEQNTGVNEDVDTDDVTDVDERKTGVDEDVDTGDVTDVDERKTGVNDDIVVEDVTDNDDDVTNDTRLADDMDTKYGQPHVVCDIINFQCFATLPILPIDKRHRTPVHQRKTRKKRMW
jgi:hypothetical protein